MTRRAIIRILVNCFQSGNKLLICGNGGSAAMASHMAGEFMGKFEMSRAALPAIALSADCAFITAFANDYPDGFHRIFARQVTALGKKGDVLIGFSTSGRSENVNRALRIARGMDMIAIDFPRRGDTTAHIQEYQFKLMHDVCRSVEKEIFS
jgi:D-sedoheptulose 7-phosphate isomerase